MASVSTDSGFVDNWQTDKTLSECNLHMLTSEDSCDVSFRVGENEDIVRAHRYVLISRSCVFHAMLRGPLAEKDDIKIPDVCKDLFVEFLKFLYTDNCCLTPEDVTGLMYLSKKYAVGGLERLCRSYLETSLSADNACVILEQAHLFDEKKLHDKALEVIVKQGSTTLMTTGFKDLCHDCLDKIVRSEDLNAKPEQVFRASLSWAREKCRRQGKEDGPQNQRLVLGESVYQIGFTCFDAKDFVKTVIPTQILNEKESLKIMSYLACPDTDVSPFRIVKPSSEVYSMDVYSARTALTEKDAELFKKRCIYDDISIMSDCDMYLHGIVLQSGGGANYKIGIRSESSELLQRTYSTTNSSSTFILDESIVLMKNTRYHIQILHESGRPPYCVGSSLNEKVELDKCTHILKTNYQPGLVIRGLLAKLIVGNSPNKGDTVQ